MVVNQRKKGFTKLENFEQKATGAIHGSHLQDTSGSSRYYRKRLHSFVSGCHLYVLQRCALQLAFLSIMHAVALYGLVVILTGSCHWKTVFAFYAETLVASVAIAFDTEMMNRQEKSLYKESLILRIFLFLGKVLGFQYCVRANDDRDIWLEADSALGCLFQLKKSASFYPGHLLTKMIITAVLPTVLPVLFWAETPLTAFSVCVALRFAFIAHNVMLLSNGAVCRLHGSLPAPEVDEESGQHFHRLFPMDYVALQLGWNASSFRLNVFMESVCRQLGMLPAVGQNTNRDSSVSASKITLNKKLMTFVLPDGSQLERDPNYHSNRLASFSEKENKNGNGDFGFRQCFLAVTYFVMPILGMWTFRALLSCNFLSFANILAVVFALVYKVRSTFVITI